MKYDIRNRWNGATQITAEIDCADNALESAKLGLAAQWAVKSRASLRGADLSGASLRGATFSGTTWIDGVTINRAPIFIGGLYWDVWLLDQHMQIGCQCHPLAEWAGFDNRQWLAMGGRAAVDFRNAHLNWLLSAAKADGRGVEAPAREAAE